MKEKYTEKKMRKIILVLALLMVLQFAFAVDVNYCCEKTVNGAWCQNAPQAECDSSFKSAPTACDSTSYCKAGCCFDSHEGLCMESTPQRVCEVSNGTWADSAKCEIRQCNLGCCILGDQGAFVTLTRCKQMSGFYGLETDFRRTITDELTCIATAQGEDKGACVFEDTDTGTATCKFTTRANCKGASLSNPETLNASQINLTSGIETKFYKDILCTAEELGSICAMTKKTTIVDGKDEVYFVDNCGNIANIYDADKVDDKAYWKKVFKKEESCGYGSNNAGSKTCGNCDYYLGSIGKKASGILGRPTYGEYICVDLSCKKQGKKHGESWCLTDKPSGEGKDTVGSRYFKEVCLYNEIITEPCADFRNQICIESKFGSFSEAACRTNRWQDCVSQEEKNDCENKDQRECMWVEGYYFSKQSAQIEKSNTDEEKGALTPTGLCVPNYPPGYQFWGSSSTSSSATLGNVTTPKFTEGNYGTGYVTPNSQVANSGQQLCSMGNAKVTIQWKKTTHPFIPGGKIGDIVSDIVGEEKEDDWECANEDCLTYIDNPKAGKITDGEADSWAGDMNEICYKLGDCGGYINWNKKYTDDGYAAYLNNKRVAGSGGSEIQEIEKKQTTTGAQAGAGTTSGEASDLEKASTAVNTVSNAKNLFGGTADVVRDLIKKIVGK